jgi:hypothetical protein
MPKSRPHQNQTTEELKTGLAAASRQARQYAQTGPKKFENALHDLANSLLDELQQRSGH